MFGTVAHCKVLPGKLQALTDYGERWVREQGRAPGEIAVYMLKEERDPDGIFMVAVFEDREAYFANANNPMTDQFYQGFRAFLQSDPEWHDGEVLDPLNVTSSQT